MRKLLLGILLLVSTYSFGQYDKIDYYIADTTMGIWSQKFNEAIFDFTGSTDTIIIGVDTMLTWSIKVNGFIDSVLYSNDTIVYGIDNFEVWRTKFNVAVDSILWPILVVNDYLATNSHYSESYAAEVDTFLTSELQKSYYETTFGDSTNADWLHVFKTDGNIALRGVGKSGNILRWEIEDVVYNQNNLPNHTLIGSDAILLLTSTDGWNGMTSFSIETNNFVEAVPKITAPNLTLFLTFSNSLTSIPELLYPLCTNFSIHANSIDGLLKAESDVTGTFSCYNNTFDSVARPEQWIYKDLGNIYLHNNSITRPSVDNVFDKTARYFAETTPIKNLNEWFQSGTNEAPTCGSNNPDILRLHQIYDSAGFTYSPLINAGSPTSEYQLPLMTMPDTIYILTNEVFEIYDDGIAGMNIGGKNINIEYTCAIGWESFYGYKFQELSAAAGYYDFRAIAKACTTPIDTVDFVISLIDGGNGTGTKTFNLIGNSLLEFGQTTYVDSLREGLTGITATMYGTQYIDPNKHEGRAGWRYSRFLGEDYPTYISPMAPVGIYDYNDYRVDSLGLGSPLDFISIQLGINDIFTTDSAYIFDNIMPDIKHFVDSMITDGTGAIIIAMPPKCENTGDGWYANYGDAYSQNDYIHRMQLLWGAINDDFSGRRYAENVFVSPQGVFIDRDNGYPKDSEGYHTNGVHPNNSGQYQLSDGLRALVEGILKDE